MKLQSAAMAALFGLQIVLDNQPKMPSNIDIYGLVTRSSSDKRMPLKPLRCAGLYKTEGACVSSPDVVTKPSPYSLGAFCLAITKTPQSGLANGPTWAALKKHRLRNTPELRRTAFLSGTEQDSRITVETGACRLNDSLKGLWMNAMQDSGEGRNHWDSTLV